MLKKWQAIALVRWMERPPKKSTGLLLVGEGRGREKWHVLKNGIHLIVTHIPLKKFVLPRRQRRKL
jgi:hypothetical protein